ncbi:MAG TPA: MFS transporter, partial [Micrococcaceae bacterium]|nr:MFS transporter [Micrococcaceae bacterium]
MSLIVGTELLPVGLLTVMANDLGVSKGAAGQSISATALVAVFSGLFITRVIGNWDRKYVSIAFSCLLLVASVLVAVAPNYQTMIAGRLLLGVPLGGFWAISAAFVMRLARKDQMSTALSIVLSGISVAMVVAAPLGSLLEPYIGWRGVFGAAAVGGLICALLQAWTLPRMPEHLQAAKAGILGLLKRPGTISAMLAMFLVFSGHIAFFTYMRPFYEEVVGIKGSQFAALLLGFCVADFAGTVASSAILRRSLVRALAGAPLVMGVCVALLCTLDLDRSVAIVITLIWGMAFGLVPVGWS